MKKTLPVLLRTLPLLFLLYSAGVLQAQVFSVSELRCEQSQRPLAVDPAGPRLSWHSMPTGAVACKALIAFSWPIRP